MRSYFIARDVTRSLRSRCEMSLIFVDCEAPFGVGSPSVGDMTEVWCRFLPKRQNFHGTDCSETFHSFSLWFAESSCYQA